jgi:hypothetical protein
MLCQSPPLITSQQRHIIALPAAKSLATINLMKAQKPEIPRQHEQ